MDARVKSCALPDLEHLENVTLITIKMEKRSIGIHTYTHTHAHAHSYNQQNEAASHVAQKNPCDYDRAFLT